MGLTRRRLLTQLGMAGGASAVFLGMEAMGLAHATPEGVEDFELPKGSGNGHHLKNTSPAMAVYLEVGSRHPDDLTTCSDIDLMSSNADGRFVRKDGSTV